MAQHARQAVYTLGMVGPILLEEFRQFLTPDTTPEKLPRGLGGSPVNLLCKELLGRGQKLVIFTTDPMVSEEVVFQGPRLKICVVPEGPHTGRRLFKREIESLRRAIERERPDVLHAQWSYEFALAALATNIPTVVTAHDAPMNVLRLNFIPYRMARTWMAIRAFRKTRRLVAVSPYVVDHLHKYWLYRRPVQVIANGMPESLFSRARTQVGNHEIRTFATVLVGWAGHKNGQVAIDAFAKVRAAKPHVRLIMFGDGHGPGEAAEAYARERGMEEGIEFAGHVAYSNLQERMAAEVDVLVHPALEEAQPMALIEAMSLGIPVIGGKSAGGVPWTLDNGDAGILIDVRSSDDMAKAMLELTRTPAMARDIGARGRQVALERFHIRVVADAYEPIYSELAGRNG